MTEEYPLVRRMIEREIIEGNAANERRAIQALCEMLQTLKDNGLTYDGKNKRWILNHHERLSIFDSKTLVDLVHNGLLTMGDDSLTEAIEHDESPIRRKD